MDNRNGVIILLGIVIIALILIGLKQNTVVKNKNNEINLYEASLDTMSKYKDDNGKLVAEIGIMKGTVKQFTGMKTIDSSMLELKELVTQYKKMLKRGGVATIIHTETRLDTVTNTIVLRDSTSKFPIYKGNVETKWFSISSRATEDFTSYNFKTRHKLSLIYGNKREKWYKPLKPVAIVNDENPHTDIKNMRIVDTKVDKVSRLRVGGYAGYGATVIDKTAKMGPQVGVGLLITF